MLEELFAIERFPSLDQNHVFIRKVTSVLKTYAILVAAIFVAAPIILLADKFVVNVLHHKSLSNQNKQTFQAMFHKLGFLWSYIFAAVFAPFFEESIFRLPLSFKKQHVVIAFFIALIYFSGSFFHPKDIMLRVAIEIAIAAVIYVVCLLLIPNEDLAVSAKNKKRWIIASICLFGLMHILNFHPIDITLLWIYPLYVIPQLVMGWGLTYMRFKNGFIWGIVLHSLINSVFVLLAYH
ncbi:CPBP family glutamic-type intramembrane protease [Mucilaginibacter sp.]|uniref:CPBP family glutamic-type intramembrane protease n=1 Tax=Mucilaginibacter sp. TaxID=1882438 RepID=UPI003D0F6107